MNRTSILIAALALALVAPLTAGAQTPAPKKAQKVHAVSLNSHPSSKKAAGTPAKEKAVKMRMAQQAEPVETVYDYASCGCF